MAAGTSTNVRASQFEAIHKSLPEIYALESGFFQKIKDGTGDKVQVAGRGLRISFEKLPPGRYGAWDPNGGSLGSGSAQVLGEAAASCVARKVAVEITKELQYHTDSKEKAWINALKSATKKSTTTFSDSANREFLRNGDCILATVSSGHTTTTITVDTTRFLQVGMAISSYSNDMTTKRTENRTVTAIVSATVFTVDGTFTSQSATDRITVEQQTSVSTPVGIYGPRYYHTNNTALYWHDVLRSTVPALATPYVSGQSGALTPALVRLGLNKLRRHRGAAAMKKGRWTWLAPDAQVDAWEAQALTMTQINTDGDSSKQGVDTMFDMSMPRIGGYPVEVSTVADPARLDFTDLDNWFKGETLPIGLYDVDGQSVFEGRDGDGYVKATQIFFITWIGQTFVEDPGRGLFIDTLALPHADYA